MSQQVSTKISQSLLQLSKYRGDYRTELAEMVLMLGIKHTNLSPTQLREMGEKIELEEPAWENPQPLGRVYDSRLS